MANINIRVTMTLVVVGVAAGLLSGLFGIGGGTVIVPALVLVGLTQRQAAATSLAAIVPTSISGVVSYAMGGDVDWVAALLLACGMVIGSQIGSWLLSRLPEMFLRWFYAVFLVFVIVSQLVFTPQRDAAIHLDAATGILLALLGVVIGVLSGLLGIGGGAVAVPSLSLLFGASDLIARGTSLLAMFPSAIAGTIAMLAGMMTPRMGANLFVAYLAVLFVRSVWTALKVTPGASAWVSGRGRNRDSC